MILARRDWRAGELGLLLASVVVAVAAIASVGFFVDRMGQALRTQATSLLGADLVIASDAKLPESFEADARQAALQQARTVSFPSMVLANGRSQLASIKAVSDGYPLRGSLRLFESGFSGPDRAAQGIPKPGEVWMDPQIAQQLGLKRGDAVALGDGRFTLTELISMEPDRGANFANFAPRVMLRLDELEATQLVQPASRVTYRYLLAGPAAAIASYEAQAKAVIEPRPGVQALKGVRIESLEQGRPELRTTLDRAQKFLALVALLTALIAAVAILIATRRFAQRHLDGCAVMRAIGLSQGELARALSVELALVGVVGATLGVAIGFGMHLLLVAAIAPVMKLSLPWPTVMPALQALACGMVLLMGFGAFPFLRLAKVPPLRVLRRDIGGLTGGSVASVAAALIAFAALLFWLAQDLRLATVALGGFAGGAVVFVGVVWLVMRAISSLRKRLETGSAPAIVRIALASWARRAGGTIVQTVALAVGLMALILLTVTRTDLIEGWRQASPVDAPNRFVINIQPDQSKLVGEQLASGGVQGVELYPMIRGRLVAINDQPVGASSVDGERAARLVEREFNLSYGATEPSHNQTIAGRWLDPNAPEASVEEGIAKTLNINLGDKLTFDIAGELVHAKTTGLRKLAWDSMKVNFFVIMSPAVLRDAPQTFITAYHQNEQGADLANRLVQQYPNLTVFDTGNIVRQVQGMLDQVVRAVQFLFILTLAAGLVVLIAALSSSRDERMRESGLMRALGASRAQLSWSQLLELGLSGGLAGILAALGATVIGVVLADQVFQFQYQARWWVVGAAGLFGAALAIGAGQAGLRGVLKAPPMNTLRGV
jgi:putative ABC transport system permease protein